MLRRLEAEEDVAEAGAGVAEGSVEGEEVEASEGAGVAVASAEGEEEALEGVGVAEVSEEGVEDKLNCCLSLISIFFQIKYIFNQRWNEGLERRNYQKICWR